VISTLLGKPIMLRNCLFTGFIIGLLLLAQPSVGQAMPIDFILSTMNRTAQTAQFTIQFTGIPNFFAVDQFGRQQDSFQLVRYDAPRQDDLGGGIIGETTFGRAVIRGEEIHWGDGLLIRNGLLDGPGIPGARTGGWGIVRETVPFVQVGQTVSLTASLHGLNVPTGPGPFGYGDMSLTFGDSSPFGFCERCTSGLRCDLSVPVPGMLWPTLLLMVGLACIMAWGRPRERLS